LKVRILPRSQRTKKALQRKLRGFFISKRPKLASGRGEMEKPLGSESCAGLVGSEFGAGGIFAEGKNQKKLPGGSFSSIYSVKV
jgi:hypothetical protein